MATEPVRRRRHGEQLESELLAAGWDELAEAGYARLTMESVAARARTGSAVLYRRWANKDELVLAAIRYHRKTNPVAVPDTGSLRGDLIAHLTAVGEALAGFFAIAAAAAFSGLLANTGLSPAQARELVMDARPLPDVRIAYQRSHDRGEIDLGRVPPAVLALPFDLVRHDLLMDLKPLKRARVESIVDELFWPLLRNYQDSTVKYQTINELFRSIMSTQRKAAEEWARSRDLTFEQAMVLGFLERQPGAIQRDVAAMSHTTASNVSLLLKGLERRGLVERRTENGNERSKRVYASPAGSRLIAGLDAAMAEVDKAVFAPLDEAEQAGLEALLGKVNARLP
ncbi:TetR/AcrR family transcriptional regulator C-terminal ligand-binding domain-containing protein [Amycolatopsis saalfeldensis]|uniref:DNA-binding transcriptional regulator, MarR family n=1 Tax=Amycolatopsis saalfeldensis TaxID=394193 RepID=A0A1H8XH55_9PSEU|nr:TetR/AcrR family transcriptional regulator C-terminal ligand-binding domain-containing protein [Amycolatopsis saalfeldensis]SEP39225.1 DNA-binding transcriptional regulator, MarR family [Amycolatopsis saalfeldensis]